MRKIFNLKPILGMQSCINFDGFVQAVPLGLIGEPIQGSAWFYGFRKGTEVQPLRPLDRR